MLARNSAYCRTNADRTNVSGSAVHAHSGWRISTHSGWKPLVGSMPSNVKGFPANRFDAIFE